MMLSRSIRRFAALAAVLAVTLQALWPLLSHARPKEAALLAPVCTVDGVTHYLEIKPGRTPLDERSASHGEHCKLCVFGGDRDAVLPSAIAPVLVAQSTMPDIRLPAGPPADPLHLLSARPRAPPKIS